MPELGGRYGVRRVEMSREGGNVTTIATKSPSQYEITLPIQNRSPSTKSPSRFVVWTLKIGFMRELGGCFCLRRAEKSRRPGAGRAERSRRPGAGRVTMPVKGGKGVNPSLSTKPTIAQLEQTHGISHKSANNS